MTKHTRKPAKSHAPNRKASARLAQRIADYERTMASSKKPAGAFHKPGSMQRR